MKEARYKTEYILYDSIYIKYKSRQNSSMVLDIGMVVTLVGGGDFPEGSMQGASEDTGYLMFLDRSSTLDKTPCGFVA